MNRLRYRTLVYVTVISITGEEAGEQLEVSQEIENGGGLEVEWRRVDCKRGLAMDSCGRWSDTEGLKE
jgi:hypothetical protein